MRKLWSHRPLQSTAGSTGVTALYSVRWALLLGLAYLLLTLSVFAAVAVQTAERNLREAQRLSGTRP